MARNPSENRERRNVVLEGRRTSLSLETQLWDSLAEIAEREDVSIDDICTLAYQNLVGSSISSSVRVFLMTYYRYLSQQFERALSEANGLAESSEEAFPSRLERVAKIFHEEQIAHAKGGKGS